MRPTPLHSLLLALAALSAAACGDSPQEPIGDAAPMPELAVPEPEFDIPPPPPDTTRWADGYLVATFQTAASYTPDPDHAYNRSGGAITITKVAGYTGRYVATFRGLSALLGTKNTVQVGGFGLDASFCKPMTGSLIQDKVEVRCFQSATGNPANAQFSLAGAQEVGHPGRRVRPPADRRRLRPPGRRLVEPGRHHHEWSGTAPASIR